MRSWLTEWNEAQRVRYGDALPIAATESISGHLAQASLHVRLDRLSLIFVPVLLRNADHVGDGGPLLAV